VIDTATRTVRYEHDLRPFFTGNEGTPGGVGGTFPFAVVVKGHGTAYVSSDRDREVVVVDVSSPVAGHLITRIKLDGNAFGMTFDESQSRLYVAQDNADQVAVIDTLTNRVIAKIDARAPAGMLPGQKYTGWTFTAEASTVLGTTTLALARGDSGVRFAAGPNITPRHSAAYWAEVTAGFDFSQADQVPPARFNRVLWTGLMGARPYPTLR
jgi:YVTN family beta-propeller protein